MGDWTWWQVVLLVISVVFTWRVTTTFNVTQWIADRHKRRKESLRVLCPHAMLDTEGGEIVMRSLVTSPFGTTEAICERCGMRFAGIETGHQIMQSWAQDPEGLLKRQKKFIKKATRVYRL